MACKMDAVKRLSEEWSDISLCVITANKIQSLLQYAVAHMILEVKKSKPLFVKRALLYILPCDNSEEKRFSDDQMKTLNDINNALKFYNTILEYPTVDSSYYINMGKQLVSHVQQPEIYMKHIEILEKSFSPNQPSQRNPSEDVVPQVNERMKEIIRVSIISLINEMIASFKLSSKCIIKHYGYYLGECRKTYHRDDLKPLTALLIRDGANLRAQEIKENLEDVTNSAFPADIERISQKLQHMKRYTELHNEEWRTFSAHIDHRVMDWNTQLPSIASAFTEQEIEISDLTYRLLSNCGLPDENVKKLRKDFTSRRSIILLLKEFHQVRNSVAHVRRNGFVDKGEALQFLEMYQKIVRYFICDVGLLSLQSPEEALDEYLQPKLDFELLQEILETYNKVILDLEKHEEDAKGREEEMAQLTRKLKAQKLEVEERFMRIPKDVQKAKREVGRLISDFRAGNMEGAQVDRDVVASLLTQIEEEVKSIGERKLSKETDYDVWNSLPTNFKFAEECLESCPTTEAAGNSGGGGAGRVGEGGGGRSELAVQPSSTQISTQANDRTQITGPSKAEVKPKELSDQQSLQTAESSKDGNCKKQKRKKTIWKKVDLK